MQCYFNVDDIKLIFDAQLCFLSRLLARVLLVPFNKHARESGTFSNLVWDEVFHNLLKKVSSVVGEVIRIGQWALSKDGKKFYQECLEIVSAGLGDDSGTRFAKMWACGLLAARKVGQLFRTIH